MISVLSPFSSVVKQKVRMSRDESPRSPAPPQFDIDGHSSSQASRLTPVPFRRTSLSDVDDPIKSPQTVRQPQAVRPPSSAARATAAQSAIVTKVHVLESDGVCRYLFPYLLKMQKQLRALKENRESLGLPALDFHTKNKVTAAAAAAASAADDVVGLPFDLGIPDTIVYEHNFPQAWYTYDVKTREMSKQSAKFLDVTEIHKGFSTVVAGTGGICAQFVGVKSGRRAPISGFGSPLVMSPTGSATRRLFSPKVSEASSVYAPATDADETSSGSVEVQYFTPDGLLAWLRDKGAAQSKEGILQKFITPRGERNDSLQFLWSPEASTLVRRANIHPLNSLRLEASVRCQTFDAKPHRVDETPGNALVQSSLCDVMGIIAQHLLKAEHKVVSRIVLHLKHDAEGRLWLLYATSLRVENSEVIGSCVVRDPVDLETHYRQAASSCSNRVIDAALKLDTSLQDRSERWKQFNTVHRSDSRYGARALHRRDTRALLKSSDKWVESRTTAQGGVIPREMSLLGSFIEDTLYTLYAARMTTQRPSSGASAFDVLVQVPPRLHDFLDVHGTQQLMLGILGMEEVVAAAQHPAVDAAAPGSVRVESGPAYRLSAAAAKRPLCIVRNECEAFMQSIRATFM